MKDRLTNNLGLKLMSILFSVLLWALVVNIDDPVSEETYRSIPVKVLHEEIFTSKGSTYSIVDGNELVSVTVRAKRSDLAKISSSDIEVTADIKNRVSNSLNEATLPTEVTVKGHDFVEAYTTPKNLEIEIEPSTQKDFSISVRTIGTARGGYELGKMKANPETIRLGGGESQIAKVKKVVAKADVSGMSKSGSVTAELKLYDSNDNEIAPELYENNLGSEGLQVEVEILKTKEIPLEFDTSDIKTAAGYTLGEVSYEPQTVTVAGEEEAVGELDKIEIPARAMKYSGVSKSIEARIDVADYLPEGISLASDTAGVVVVTVSVEKYGTKVFNIPSNNIILENALAGLKPSVAVMENIEIHVTGSDEALEELTEAPKVYVDLEKYTNEGTVTVPIQAELPSGCSLVGSVSVQITLTKQESGGTS